MKSENAKRRDQSDKSSLDKCKVEKDGNRISQIPRKRKEFLLERNASLNMYVTNYNVYFSFEFNMALKYRSNQT